MSKRILKVRFISKHPLDSIDTRDYALENMDGGYSWRDGVLYFSWKGSMLHFPLATIEWFKEVNDG